MKGYGPLVLSPGSASEGIAYKYRKKRLYITPENSINRFRQGSARTPLMGTYNAPLRPPSESLVGW